MQKKCYRITVTLRSPLHINGGTDADGTRVPVMMGGKPYIPATAMKGMIRDKFSSYLKMLGVDSCTGKEKAEKSCGCPACVLFGKVGFQPSRVFLDHLTAVPDAEPVLSLRTNVAIDRKLRFKDASYISQNGKVCQYEKCDGVGIDRDTGAAAGSAKFDYEIVPRGSRFRFALIAENLDTEQKKQLEFIIALLEGSLIPDDYLAFGGKTTRGLGRMRLENTHTETVDQAAIMTKCQAIGLTAEKG